MMYSKYSTQLYVILFFMISSNMLMSQSLEVEGDVMVRGAEGVISPLTKIGTLKSDSLTTINAEIGALLSNKSLHVGADGVTAEGNVTTSGWTQLGDSTDVTVPIFKMKQISGTTSGSQGGTIAIPHGLDSSKFISVSPVVIYNPNGNGVTENYRYNAGFEFTISWSFNNISIVNISENSENILSKPVVITILYTP